MSGTSPCKSYLWDELGNPHRQCWFRIRWEDLATAMPSEESLVFNRYTILRGVTFTVVNEKPRPAIMRVGARMLGEEVGYLTSALEVRRE
ncbi:hypothetical protein ACHAPT_003821 [Fusarium lateritium]